MDTHSSFADRLADAVRALIAPADVPGATIALTIDGRSHSLGVGARDAGVGARDADRTHPIDAEARFYLYSITKVLLVIAALRLVEAGRLALDRPLHPLLPELPRAAPITLRHLLAHTSGLPDYGGLPAYHHAVRTTPSNPWTADEFLARTLPHGLLFPPGQGWAYSNIGYLLVRQAIERLTQRPLRDALADLVFRPLDVRQAAAAASLAEARALTPGYSTDLSEDGVLRDVSRRYHPGWVAHGVVIASAVETARILDALFAGRLIGTSALAEMLEPTPVPWPHRLIAAPAYGLGLMLDLGSPYGRVAGHAGEGPGYTTAAFHFPNVAGQRLTAVALVNRDRPDLALELAFALADVVAGARGPAGARAIVPPPYPIGTDP